MTRRLRILEVAALPFPSRQGTQVLLDAIARGLAERGHDVHLLTYAHGAFPVAAPYTLHRVPDAPQFRSLRSGPDWRRAALDLRLAAEVRRLARSLRPDLLHLHNVEAAAATLLLPLRPRVPCVYHAHNLMEHELPTYDLPATLRTPAGRFGRFLDRALPARADLTLAVSAPTRAGLLAAGADPARVRVVEPGVDMVELSAAAGPGRVLPHASSAAAPSRQLNVVHLGNLDRYQGIDRLLAAVAALRARGRDAVFTAVTDSEPAPVRALAEKLGVPARFVPHGSLLDAVAAVRRCQVAALARTVPGGFSIKLLVLLHARIPLAAVPSAVAGLDLDDAIRLARSDEPEALAEALLAAAEDPERTARSERGARLARERFSTAAAAERIEVELSDLA
jgi:glycosyltransferase involved in cell wall biosynthesis